jgi:ABC-type multidrug transport system fused ATPase/permease subunit
MKKRFFLVIILSILILAMGTIPIRATEKPLNIYVFYSKDCSHCAAQEVFFEELSEKDKSLVFHRYEVVYNKENQGIMKKVGDLIGTPITTVPFVLIGRFRITGFTEGITDIAILEAIQETKENPVRDLVGEMLGIVDPGSGTVDYTGGSTFTLPFIGKIDVTTVSIPLVAIILGTLDGFNPCAMWTLLFLMGMLFRLDDKKKIWILGGAFLFTSAFMYFLFMLSWLNIAVVFGSVSYIRWGIGLIAVIGGILNLRLFMKAPSDGCEIVDDNKRRKLKKKVLSISNQPIFYLAILGIMGLALSVNFIELLCSAGFPVIFTQILALQNLNPIQYVGYLLLYILFYLLDDLLVFFIAMKTMTIFGISTKYGKWSHLIGGILMIAIGLLMVLKPAWLQLNFN